MSKIEEGKKIPDFSYEATGGVKGKISQLKGRPVILYFYPKDATPGCTLEGQQFRDQLKAFSNFNALVFGVSRDSLASHEKFKDKHAFPFQLISDESEKLCTLFDVIKMKNMYGKQVRGIERSTFLIDADGVLQKAWRKVKVDGHVADVLATLKVLKK